MLRSIISSTPLPPSPQPQASKRNEFDPIRLHCELGNTFFRGFWTLQVRGIKNDSALNLLKTTCDKNDVIVKAHTDLMWDEFTVGRIIESFSEPVRVHAYTKELLTEFAELLHQGVQVLNVRIKPPPCSKCGGAGRTDESCLTCSGQGKVEYSKKIEQHVACPQCEGKGFVGRFLYVLWQIPCQQCGGRAKVTDVRFDHHALKDCPDCDATGKKACSECS